ATAAAGVLVAAEAGVDGRGDLGEPRRGRRLAGGAVRGGLPADPDRPPGVVRAAGPAGVLAGLPGAGHRPGVRALAAGRRGVHRRGGLLPQPLGGAALPGDRRTGPARRADVAAPGPAPPGADRATWAR